MVAQYTVLGRQIGSHVLAMITLGGTAGGIFFAMGGKEKAKESGPPTNASSSDEEKFIQDFIKDAQGGEKAKQ